MFVLSLLLWLLNALSGNQLGNSLSMGRFNPTLLLIRSYGVGTSGQAFLNPDGSIVSGRTVYDDAGRAVESVDELGHRSTSVYDASGALVASTIYDGPNADIARTSRSLYDKAGRTVRSIDALGRYSEPTYEDGRVVSTASYSAAGTKLNESFTSYDALGRVTASKDASGHVKRMVYDELGRLEKVIQATQGVPSLDGTGAYDLVTSFGYDELGRKIWQRDAKGRYTRFGYDERGRNIWRALPMNQVERMSYNAGGQLTSSTDFRGFVTTYRYDTRGRLTLKAPDSRLGEATLSYEYPDENTRIAYRGSAATTQRYDAQRGWLDSVEGPNGVVEYAYNAAGQKTATATDSGVTRYGYDTLGRLKTISDQPTGAPSATPIASYSYDAVGNLAGVMRGNGVASSYDYDDLNRLQTLTHAKGAATLASYGYTTRGDGKRTAISESVLNADAGRVTTRSLTYEFDASGRLTLERGRDGLGVAYENAFTYDSVGNRTLTVARRAANAATTTFAHETSVTGVFNANDQLTSESSVVDGGALQLREYDYDGNGAEKTVTAGGQTSTNGWSFEGKLTATAKSSGGGIANSFDAAGDRLARVENVGLPSQKTTKYLVDTDVAYAQVIEERAPDSTDAGGASLLQARYVWGPGLAPLAMWRKGDDGVVRLSYYLADGQESVRQLADASGEVTDSYHFDAFGRTLSGGSGETENPFRYTGQQLDPDGRYYLRARFYNPGNGRFLSHDPLLGEIHDPISMHRYLYAGADGVNGVDPSGTVTLTEVLTAKGINATLVAMGSKAINVASAIATGVSAANLYGDYQATGEVNKVDGLLTAASAVPLIGQGFAKLAGLFSKTMPEVINTGRGIYSLFGWVKPSTKVDPAMQQFYLDLLDSPAFAKALGRYNKMSRWNKGTVEAASIDDIRAALMNNTTFARTSSNWLAAVFVGAEHPYATRFLLQGTSGVSGMLGPTSSKRAAIHELIHVGAALKGQPDRLMHEIFVQCASTPELLGAAITAGSWGVFTAATKWIVPHTKGYTDQLGDGVSDLIYGRSE